jgi:hypothetical protein
MALNNDKGEEMNNYAAYITPEQARANGDTRSLGELRALARNKKKCCNCDEPVWRYGGCGMCFSCTTGESDASGDYELEQA